MAMSAANADAKLNADLRGQATPHLWLHTGDPGAAGTANVAEYDGDPIARKPVAFDAPENHPSNVERRILSSVDVEWTGAEIDPGQTITHFSIWSAATGGDCLYIAPVAEPKIVGSDGVTVPVGELEVAIGVYAKP